MANLVVYVFDTHALLSSDRVDLLLAEYNITDCTTLEEYVAQHPRATPAPPFLRYVKKPGSDYLALIHSAKDTVPVELYAAAFDDCHLGPRGKDLIYDPDSETDQHPAASLLLAGLKTIAGEMPVVVSETE